MCYNAHYLIGGPALWLFLIPILSQSPQIPSYRQLQVIVADFDCHRLLKMCLTLQKLFMILWCQKKKTRVHAQGLEQNYSIVACKIERVGANKFAYGVRIQNYLLKASFHGLRSRDSGRGVLFYEATHVVACENRSAHNFRFEIGMWTFCPHTQDNLQRSLILKLFPLILWAFSSDLVYRAVL